MTGLLVAVRFVLVVLLTITLIGFVVRWLGDEDGLATSQFRGWLYGIGIWIAGVAVALVDASQVQRRRKRSSHD